VDSFWHQLASNARWRNGALAVIAMGAIPVFWRPVGLLFVSESGGEQYFTSQPSSTENRRVISVWLAGREVDVETGSGVFSPEHIDQGTQVLMKEAGDLPASGIFLDVGCGWGPLALAMALASPEATVWAVDINERSRDLTAANAARLGLANVFVAAPDDVPADLRFDIIWSNPPIRVGKAALHEILTTWLTRLSPEGEATLVVAKHLGAPSLLTWLRDRFGNERVVERIAQSRGFHVISLGNSR
jgi:16S rRNA G1207 methylase RsmC